MSRATPRPFPTPRVVSAGLAALVVLAAACGPSELDAYCERVDELAASGPLFPTRTDGEPVPDLDALEAIEAVAEAAPSEIADEATVLADEARALVEEAEARRANRSIPETSDRWSPSVVEQAQNAVIEHVDAECGLDLTHLGRG